MNKYLQDPQKRERLIAEGHSKCCSTCKTEKAIEDYYWIKTSNQPMCKCKECWKANRKAKWHSNDGTMRAAQKRYNEANKERIAEYRRERYRNDPEYRARLLENNRASQARKKAKKDNK